MICISYTWRPVFALTTFDPTRHAPLYFNSSRHNYGGGHPYIMLHSWLWWLWSPFAKQSLPLNHTRSMMMWSVRRAEMQILKHVGWWWPALESIQPIRKGMRHCNDVYCHVLTSTGVVISTGLFQCVLMSTDADGCVLACTGEFWCVLMRPEPYPCVAPCILW